MQAKKKSQGLKNLSILLNFTTRIAAHQDSAIYFGCPDLDGAYAHLRGKRNNAKEPRIAPYGMKQLYLADPDGCVLCFQWQAQGQARALSHLRSRDQRSSPHSHFVNVVSTFRSEPAS